LLFAQFLKKFKINKNATQKEKSVVSYMSKKPITGLNIRKDKGGINNVRT